MDLLQDGLSEDGRLFWCLMETEESPRKDIEELVISKNGHFVPIDSFDKLMFFVGEKMGFKLLHERIEAVAKERTIKYKEQVESMGKSIAEGKDNHLIKISLSEMINRIENSPWYFELLAQQETDTKRKEKIYKSGLDKFPETYELVSGYAKFLHYIRKSLEAEKYYKKALELKPEDAAINGNYAVFLQYTKKDSDEAEKYYKKALELKPEDANINGNYAVFLKDIKKDSDEAEKYYKKALELKPESAAINVKYAHFLKDIKKDSDEAEKYYKKALELKPESAAINVKYAHFLKDIKKDSDEAEKYYKKALELEPENTATNGNYAIFLQQIKRDNNEAEKYYKKILELDPEDAVINGNYALLLLQRGQLNEAKKFIDKAFHYNQLYEQEELKLELWFYRYACFYEDYPESKEQVTRLLNDGIRSPGWNLTDLVEKVKEMHHPEYAQVVKFANQISAP